MNSAIILAGGNGSRMENDTPKQFILINNKMIIEYSVEAFLKNKKIDEIIIVCAKEWANKLSNLYPVLKIVVGGESRTQSSFNGLKACSKNTENVLIHDSARPMINQKIINDCITMLKNNDAAIPMLDCYDSVLNIESMDYMDRQSIKLIQTPQAFNFKKIYQAYNSLNSSFTDDFSLFNHYNSSSKNIFFNGFRKNIKITTSDDLVTIKNYLNE